MKHLAPSLATCLWPLVASVPPSGAPAATALVSGLLHLLFLCLECLCPGSSHVSLWLHSFTSSTIGHQKGLRWPPYLKQYLPPSHSVPYSALCFFLVLIPAWIYITCSLNLSISPECKFHKGETWLYSQLCLQHLEHFLAYSKQSIHFYWRENKEENKSLKEWSSLRRAINIQLLAIFILVMGYTLLVGWPKNIPYPLLPGCFPLSCRHILLFIYLFILFFGCVGS